jgi:hypothetical protein
MQKTRDNGLLQSTYDVEMVASPLFEDGQCEMERVTVGSESSLEDTLAYALEAWEKLRPETADFETCELRPDCIGAQWYMPFVGIVQFVVEEDSPTHKCLNALRELLRRLEWYSKKPHPAHAYEIGKAEMLLRALMDSKQVRRGQKNIDALKKATVKGAGNSKTERGQRKAQGYAEYFHLYKKGTLRGVAGYKRIAKLHGDDISQKYGIGAGYKTVERAVKALEN